MASLNATPLLLFTLLLLLLLPWDASADVCKKVECGKGNRKEPFNFVPCKTPNHTCKEISRLCYKCECNHVKPFQCLKHCIMDCIGLGLNFDTTKPLPRPTVSRRRSSAKVCFTGAALLAAMLLLKIGIDR